MMDSVNPLSDTSGEVASLGISHIMKPTSQNDSNAVSAMNQPIDPELFRFLDLPPEIRNKIYGNLLIYHKPIVLDTIYMPDNREWERVVYLTRLGLAPQICRASKAVACECFAILYGENTFHFTSDSRISSLYLAGIDMYLHYFKTIVMDTFMSSYKAKLQDTSLGGQSTYLPDARLVIESEDWVTHDTLIEYLENVKKLRLSLPPGLDNLTGFNRDALLEIKRVTPKDATVEFHGAASHIVSQLMNSWPNHVPKPIESELIQKDMRPFNPLKWCEEQAAMQNREKSKFSSSIFASTFPTTQATTLKRQSLEGYLTEDPRANKRLKLEDTEAQFLASEYMKLAEEEKTLAGEEGTLASKEKGLAEEKIALEKKRLALERSRLALENRKLAIKDEKIPPSPASTVSM